MSRLAPGLSRGRRALALLATSLLGCAELAALSPPASDPRMLRATIGPGDERLVREMVRDRVVLDVVAGQGRPDYVWAPAPDALVLLFLAADRAIRFGGVFGARRRVETLEPIPDEWLDLVAPDDRDAVRARRADLAGHARAERPGWCASAEAEAPASRACLRDPVVEALLAEIRQKVLDAWRGPPPEHGGERVIVRFRVARSGALLERCTLGATSPRAAQVALEAFDAAFPLPPLAEPLACVVGRSVVARFEVETD